MRAAARNRGSVMNTSSSLQQTIPGPPGATRSNSQFRSWQELLRALGSQKIHGRTVESQLIYQGRRSKRKKFKPDYLACLFKAS